MALPPSIPTSFVPHSSSVTPQRFRSDFTGAFASFCYGVLGIVFLLAIGIFFYGRYLSSDQAAKDATLAKQTAAIDRNTVVGFVRLRNRLNLGAKLLDNHVAASGFFAALEQLMPTNVRLTSLHLSVDTTSNTAKIEGQGVAKSFNALAVVSSAFAADGRIKDAIFSKIAINKDSSVSFNLSATLDQKLTTFSIDSFSQSLPAQAAQPAQATQPAQQPVAPASLSAPAAGGPAASSSSPAQ